MRQEIAQQERTVAVVDEQRSSAVLEKDLSAPATRHQRSTPAVARKSEPAKPIETPPPFTVVGIEYRGGERFLSVAPPGSTQLSELYLVRPGDNVGGTRWRLANLDDRQAQFSVDGATRTLSVK